MDEVQLQEHLRSWYNNKAKSEHDPFYKFLCHWICVNAWLDYESPATTDGEMITWLTEQTSNSSSLIRAYDEMALSVAGKQALQNLASLSPIGDDRSKNPKPPLVISDSNDKIKIIKGVYRIRCNLFHGKKRPTQDMERDEKLVRYANDILDGWLAVLIKGWTAR
jgi:hypothetical protein